jgi:mono/diheme cytochrome c family protein
MAIAVASRWATMADPTDTSYIPRPEWYFLFLFQMLKVFEGPLEVVGTVVLPTLAILALFLTPFIDRLAAFLLKLTPENASALADAPDFAVRGAVVYQTQHCAACHMVNGVGMKVGPPLNGLARRQARSWVDDHFANPQKLSPGSIMPPYQLSAEDKKNLTAYLFTLPE